MRIPNIDGTYQTKDKRVIVVVTRKEIEIELKENSSDVHIIDDDAPKRGGKGGKPDALDVVMNSINKTSKILMGN
jgi:hypothetical protein